MNILVTINKGYVEQLKVLLRSLVKSNPKINFIVYVFHKDLDDYDIDKLAIMLFISAPDWKVFRFPRM